VDDVFEALKREGLRFGAWLASIPFWVFAGLFGAVAISKAAFIWRLPNVHGAAPAFPEPTQNSDLFMGIVSYQVVGGSSWGYLILNMTALIAAVAIVWLSGGKSDSTTARGRVRFLLAISWPLAITQLTWFGHGTEFLPLGVALALLARNRVLWIFGVLVTTLSHPTQGFAIFVTLLFLTLAPEFHKYRARALTGVLVGAVGMVGFSLWIHTAGIPSRIPLAVEVLPKSFLNALRHGILGLYSGWGVWWILLLLAIFIVGTRTRLLLIFTGVVLPSIATMIAWDGTRDFVAVAAAVGLAMFALVMNRNTSESSLSTSVRQESKQPEHFLLALATFAFLLLPNVQIMMIGDGIPEPGWMWVGLFENYLLPQLT
jgi:hypothetical protein